MCKHFYIQNVSIENASNTNSVANESKYNVSDDTEKHMLYKQFVAWNSSGCSVAPLVDYLNNPIYQELPTESEELPPTQTKEFTLI